MGNGLGWNWKGAGAPAALAAAGAAGWLLAWQGFAGTGALVWLAGTVLGSALHRRGRHAALPRSLGELLRGSENGRNPHAALVEEVRALSQRLDAHGEAFRDVVRQLQEHATLVAWVIDTLNQSVTDARENLKSMQQAMGRVGEHALEVEEASRRGTDSIGRMGSSTEALFHSAATLNNSVEEATASVTQIHGALSGVQQGVALLSESSDRTTEFISQVGKAMGGIRGRIEQSLELAKKVETYARTGREVVEQVGDGIERIQTSSQNMAQSVQALGSQSREIEGVLGIITDVAEETGLLSLNAAILAAQAGEKGAAFAVVADQIRSLARRTRESTKHIEELIRGIQGNITEANLGLAASLETVDQGRDLGHEAVRQLELIERAVAESVDQARQIAGAAQEQDEKSGTMVSAAGEVNESLHQVAENLGQSILEMDRIQTLIQSLAALSQSLRAAADEHREGGRETAELMDSFSSRVEGIRSLVDSQEEAAVLLGQTLDQVADSADSTGESLDSIHSIVKEMVGESDELRDELRTLWADPTGGTEVSEELHEPN